MRSWRARKATDLWTISSSLASLFLRGGILSIVLVVIASGLPAQVALARPPLQEEVPERPPASMGRGIFAESCAPCHGEEGRGDGPAASGLPAPPTSFADLLPLQSRSPQEMFQVVKEGRLDRGMPPWKNRLRDAEIWVTVAYLYDLNLSAEDYETGRAIYETSCASCHGSEGRGDGPEAGDMAVPDLSRWPAGINVSNQDWLESIQSSETHSATLAGLDPASTARVVGYMRTLGYGSVHEPLEGAGVILGTVMMISPEEPADFSGLEVTLRAFRGSLEPALTVTTTVDAMDTFRFENLSTAPDVLYSISTRWEGAFYSSGVVTFPPGEDLLPVTLRVAAATEEDPGLRADQVHWFIDITEQGVDVVELVSISNPGDRAYKGRPVPGFEGARAAVRWALPQRATDVVVDGGEIGGRFLLVDNTLVDTLPVSPGRNARRLLFRYRLPLEGRKVRLVHPLSMPVPSLTAFIADRGQKVQTDELTQGESRDVNGVPFISYTGRDFSAGDEVEILLEGLPAGGQRARQAVPETTARLAGVILAALAGVALFAVMVYRVRRPVVTAARQQQAYRVRRDLLLAEIAALDNQFEAGELDEATYREERDTRLVEAVRLTRLLGDGQG